VFAGSSPITFTSPSSKAHQKSGSFPLPTLPGFNGRMTLSDSRHGRRLEATLRPLPSPVTGLPRLLEPPFRRAVPTTPADRAGARVDCFPAHTAFPKWQEGRHPHCHFRGLLRFHSRYGPPGRSAAHATFVTRLQPLQLPARAARQLPDQSTTLRVESSSTGDSRLRGALPETDVQRHAFRDRAHLANVGPKPRFRRQRSRPERPSHVGTALRSLPSSS